MFDKDQLTSIGFRFAADNTELVTPYGEELSRRPHFYGRDELMLLKTEQHNVSVLMDAVREDIAGVNALLRLMMPIKDIRRSIAALEARPLSEVELFEVKRFLLQLELIAPQVEKLGRPLWELSVTAMPKALDLIDPDGTRSPSFYVSDRLSEKLAAIRRARRSIDERMRMGDDSEEIRIERTRVAAREEEENARVRALLCERLKPYREELLNNAAAIGRLDLALGKARLAVRYGAVMPEIGSDRFLMKGMINPKFAEALSEKGRGFVPVSMELEKGSVVITGANMGGKSIAIKTLALNAMLAMCGYAVFAESAELPLIDDLYLLSEDREDAMSGLSSFGGEMKAFDAMLSDSGGKECVLVLLDEFARGTNPHEGAALVKAAAKLFNARGNTYAVLATHFDGVAKLGRLHYQVAGLRNADPEKLDLIMRSGSVESLARLMDYGLYPVAPDEDPPRDAVKIIKALGVSGEFTRLIDIK